MPVLRGAVLAALVLTPRLRAEPPPFRVSVGHVVLLRTGERLTGQLLSLDGDTLRLRTAWSDKVDLPRSAIAALTQLPGLLTLFDDDFRGGAKACALPGQPAGKGAAVLAEPRHASPHLP